MIDITEEVINTLAPNQNSISNGLGLVKKNSFVKLNISEDKTLLFGECKGSGSSNYITSADFIKPDSPVFRCSCPSRQFPCKHAIGLLFAYLNKKDFTVSHIPQDISEKREKADKKEEKKKEKVSTEPKKVNKSALKKKIQLQIEGLSIVEKVTGSIVRSGLCTINTKTIQLLEEQIRQLGNYYITGPQIMLRDFALLYKNSRDYENVYSTSIELLLKINSLCKKGKELLYQRLENSELKIDGSSLIDELLGHAWQLADLKQLGMFQNDVELVQLGFNSFISQAREEYVDWGVWINLKSGEIGNTFNYRPFKALKYIKEDDSFFKVAQVKELFLYPGEFNPRIRWENMNIRDISLEDYSVIRSHGKDSYQEIIKAVKNLIKNPLSDKNPVILINYSMVGKVNGEFVIQNEKGERLVLEDNYSSTEPHNIYMLELLHQKVLEDNSMLVKFHQNPQGKKLRAQPIAIVTNEKIIRLV